MRITTIFLIPVLLSALFMPNFSMAKDVVMNGKERNDYVTTILRHALTYIPDKNYRVTFYNEDLPKVRVFQYIKNKKHIDIIVGASTLDREEMMLPVYFPLLKGLYGWRISLVNNDNPQILSPAQNPNFKSLVAGQLHSWADTKILESNEIKVEKGSDYEGLYAMLEHKRFDYFPRSAIEVFSVFKKHRHYNLSIDQNIIIHYPAAYYFYVNKENTDLAIDIKYGLEQALKDGSFDEIFMSFYGSIIGRVKKEKRIIYRLNNPYLSDKTPLTRDELWLDFNNL